MNANHPGELAHVIDGWLDGREIIDGRLRAGQYGGRRRRAVMPDVTACSQSDDRRMHVVALKAEVSGPPDPAADRRR
jgi:hypothetical protein